jgi:hypothetical protein
MTPEKLEVPDLPADAPDWMRALAGMIEHTNETATNAEDLEKLGLPADAVTDILRASIKDAAESATERPPDSDTPFTAWVAMDTWRMGVLFGYYLHKARTEGHG